MGWKGNKRAKENGCDADNDTPCHPGDVKRDLRVNASVVDAFGSQRTVEVAAVAAAEVVAAADVVEAAAAVAAVVATVAAVVVAAAVVAVATVAAAVVAAVDVAVALTVVVVPA